MKKTSRSTDKKPVVEALGSETRKVKLTLSEEHKCREAFDIFATPDMPEHIKLKEMSEILRIIAGPGANSLMLSQQL
jgi:hypothetical protein